MESLTSDALWTSPEAFLRVFNSVNDAIFLHRVDGRILEVNETMLRMYGVTREEALRMSIAHDFSGAECPVERLHSLWDEVVSGTNKFLEWKARRPNDGSKFDVELFLTRISIQGEPAVLATVRDISERKRLEEQLLHSQKMEAIGLLAGGVAHDFNNLLTVITGYSEMLLAQTGDISRCFGELEQIRNAADNAAALTRQLLIFSRKHVVEPKLLDLKEVLARLGKMLVRMLGEDVELSMDIASSIGLVRADPSQLEQVIVNLVVNARDAMPNGGRLAVEAQNVDLGDDYARRHIHVTPGPYVLLAISDTGQGMNAATQARIFEPFFTTKEQGKGTGLGLSIVYGIVKQAGGAIWVYSEPGCGTTFKIYLPRIDGSVALSGKKRSAVARGSETILVIEDNTHVRELTCEVLRGAGYSVLEGASARQLPDLLHEHPGRIHLLLTDVVLGQVNGREVAQTAQAKRPDMKVLFMSGYTSHAVVETGILEPGLAFLPKPFTPADLARRVREVLDSN